MSSGQEIGVVPTGDHNVTALATSNTGGHLASGHGDGSIGLWEWTGAGIPSLRRIFEATDREQSAGHSESRLEPQTVTKPGHVHALESPRPAVGAGRITEVLLFAEPLHAFTKESAVTVSAPETLIPQADQALDLHGALIRFASGIIQGEIVAPMTEAEKRRYIANRCGPKPWACYHARTDMYKYNVVVVFS